MKNENTQIDAVDHYDKNSINSVVESISQKEIWVEKQDNVTDIKTYKTDFFDSEFQNVQESNLIEPIEEVQPVNNNIISVEEIKNNYNELNDNTSITALYEQNLIPEDNIIPKKDEGLIDFGPVEEEDEIFSTPRRDSDQDDIENFSLSKEEKKALKKRRKAEELNRKKYSKLLK